MPAQADDYTDLLEILRAHGSLSQTGYITLLHKHQHGPKTVARGRHGATTTEAQPDQEAVTRANNAALAAVSAGAILFCRYQRSCD